MVKFMGGLFANEDFYQAIDIHRENLGITWSKAADQANVSASTFTRIAQGKKPDVDTLSALCRWAHLDANQFLLPKNAKIEKEPVAEAMALFRADPNLSEPGRRAIEALVKEAYKQFKVE